jgi:D-alanyl-D-alanine carboxypeptidase
MRTYLLLTIITASLLLAACVPQAPVTAPPQPTVEPTAAPTTAPAAEPTPAAEEPSATLTANPWQWTGFSGAVEQFKVEQPGNYVLTFKDDGTLEIKADCNNAFADYTADDSSVSLKPGPMTLVACPPDSRSEQFIKLLGGAAKYFFADGKLFIDLMADGGTMRLDPAGATADADAAAADQVAAQLAAMVAGVMANPWKWTALTTATEEVTVETPASYMVTFKDDGRVDIKADCNNATGTYTLDGANVTIEVGAATLAACPGKSRSEQFLQLLGDAAQMLPLNGQLYISLKTEGSTMILDPVLTTVVDLCGEKAVAINEIEDTLAPEISAQLDQGLVSLVQAAPRPGPGASMLIITPKGRYFKSTGVADVTNCEPLAADSPYQIGSNTKLMTSAILFQLQEEGKLSTSDLLSKWLPDLAAQLPNGDKVTIDMMMTHTSGLFDYFDVPTSVGSIADGAKDKAMLTRAFTPEELVKVVADSDLSEFEPGAEGKWKYSNTGYILLGLIIEKASDKTYEENLKERIFEPLNLKQTYLQTGQPEAGALPQAYFHSPFDFTTGEWNASQGWSAGAVVSTPEEFAVFLKALFTGKLFKQPSTLDLMKQHTSAGVDALGPGTVYAHGMLDNQGVLGHGGQTLGFQSDGGYIPDKDVTIVMWSNAAESNVSRAIVPAIANAVLGDEQAGQAAPAAASRHEPLDKCFAQPPEGLDVDLDMDCGYVTVPESRSGASDREVKLGFTRFNSGKGTASSPLFMLAGGPGQTQISPEFFSMFQAELLGGILNKRDIVIIEQRGTEHTAPFLNCPEVLSAPWDAHEKGLSGKEAAAFEINTLQECIDDFKAQGVNFDAYNSVENAADVNAVREALGYDKIIYYGASYGSQLGQHVMRDFPQILEAVVLDGAEALSRKSWVENKALDAQWGLDNLTRLCEADAKCKAAYDIPALVDAVLALFDKGPLPYSYTDPNDASLVIKGEVTLDDMVSLIYGQQGTRTGALSLPAFLAQLAEGGAEIIAEVLGSNKAGNLIASRTATTSPMALLMHMAMVCSDDPVKSAAEVKLDGAGRYATLFGQAGGAEYAEFCSLIKVKELPDATDVDVTLDVPTLLLSGDLDVATPTFRSQEVADTLPNGTLVVFPGRTHVQIAAANICAAQVMTQFVLDPTTKPDTSCVKDAPVLGFVLPDGSNSREAQ